MTSTIDTSTVPTDQAKAIEEMVSVSDFFNLPKDLDAPEAGRGADRFGYEISIELDDRRHTVQMKEGQIPAALKPLIDLLNQKARSDRLSGKKNNN